MDCMSKVLLTNAVLFHERNSEVRNTEEMTLNKIATGCIAFSGKILKISPERESKARCPLSQSAFHNST